MERLCLNIIMLIKTRQKSSLYVADSTKQADQKYGI